jgi:heat shock protein HslJ
MKSFNYLILSIGSFFLFACGSSSNSTTTVNPHAQAHSQMHNEFKQEKFKKELIKIVEDLSGTYVGDIPCADCEKIIFQLQLNEDFTYKSKVIYQGKSDAPIEKSGSYTIKSNLVIQLDEKDGSMNLFKKNGNGLLMLDKNGNEITGDLGENYSLFPIKTESSKPDQDVKQQYLLKKWKEGVDFYAMGNEPFWSLDMDFDKVFKFKNLDGVEFNAPNVEPISAMDADVKRYRTVTDAGEIIIQLIHTKCIDNMSSEEFHYAVTVDYKASSEKDYKTYKGCGKYVPDPRLNYVWTVKEVEGLAIDRDDSKRKTPKLEFEIFQNKISGNDGCNGFHGEFELLNNSIVFGYLASTLMACPDMDMDLGSKIKKYISGNSVNYKIKNNELFFMKKDKVVMVFEHLNE